MLHLIAPPYQYFWIGGPMANLVESVGLEKVSDLDIEWRKSEEPHLTSALVELALRHGTPVPEGIILESEYVLAVYKIDEHKKYLVQARELEETLLRSDDILDDFVPGWKSGKMNDLELANNHLFSLMKQKMQELEQMLAHPVRDDLLIHWKEMGGITR